MPDLMDMDMAVIATAVMVAAIVWGLVVPTIIGSRKRKTMGKTKVKTREQLEERVQDLREQLLSNKRGVLDAIEQRRTYQMKARKYRTEEAHVAWEREAGGRPQITWRGDINWIEVNEDSSRYSSQHQSRLQGAERAEQYAEDQLKKIAEATAMVELTKTMLAANETRLQAKDFWYDLFWPVTIWLACRSRPRASQPR